MAEIKEKMELDEVSDIVTQMLSDDREKMAFYAKVDEAVNCVFNPDPAVANLPFITGRSFALTDIADAKNAGTRVFTSLLPNITVAPVMDNQGEYERTDKMEQAWKWEIERMNRPSSDEKGVHDQIVESAITYHAVALQTEYLPYKFKNQKNDPRIKNILARKCFQWTLHHPGTVHTKRSKYGLEQVAKVAKYSALDLIQEFGEGNEGVMRLKEENRNAKLVDLMNMQYELTDYTNWTYRAQYIKSGNKKIEFMNEKHGLSFIPWVIINYGNPLWEAVIKSGHWDNLQHMKLIKFARAVAMGARSDIAIQTQDGTLRGVWMDYQNPTNPIVLPPGATIIPLRPQNLDPQFEAEYQENRSDVSRSTVARILQDSSQYANAPFSTFNAAITSAMGQLAPAKMTAQTASSEAIYQGFQWIEHSKIPFVAYRKRSGDSKIEGEAGYKAGSQIIITPETPPTKEEWDKLQQPGNENALAVADQKVYFDLANLYITVGLQSDNLSDEQARLNTFILAKRELGMSKKDVWEKMNWDNFDMSQAQSATENLFDGEVAAMLKRKDMAVDMEAAQQQAALQEEAARKQAGAANAQNQQNAMNQLNAGTQGATLQGQDMRGGGMPAAGTMPNENRVSIQGQDAGGLPA